MFHAWAFRDIMTFIKYLKKLKFNYLKNRKSFWSEIKNFFSLFHKCSPLDLQNKLAKM